MHRIILSLVFASLMHFAAAAETSAHVLSATVEGRLVAAITGEPVRDASLTAKVGRDIRTASSDAEGAFSFARLIPGSEYALAIDASGFAPYAGKFTAKPEPLRLILQREGVLVGRVVRDGSPVAGATVEYADRRVVTDASGQYRIGGLGNAWDKPVAWTDTLVPMEKMKDKVRVRIARQSQAPLLSLVPGCTVDYTVKDASTGRLRDAQIEFRQPETWMQTITPIARGKVRLVQLPPWELSAVVTATGYFEEDVKFSALPAGATHTFATAELSPLPVVRGRVVDAQGAGIADATVRYPDFSIHTLLRGDRFGNRYSTVDRSVPTGATGGFQITVDQLKPVRLEASKVGYCSGEARGVTPGSSEVVITLREGGGIGGRVVQSDGAAAPAARVILKPDHADYARPMNPLSLGYPPSATSDAQGRYRFAHLVPGRYDVQATAQGLISRLMQGLVVEDGSSVEAPDLILTSGHSFSGVVVEQGNDKPIEGILVGLDGDGQEPGDARSDAAGAFALHTLVPGKYRVTVAYEPDHRHAVYVLPSVMTQTVIEIVDQDITDYRIALKPGAFVTGHVLDAETGEPIAGASVQPVGRGMGDIMRMIESGNVVTGEDGAFSLTSSSVGAGIKLSATHRDYAMGESEALELVAGQTFTDVEIALSKGHCISGVVLDVDGRPAAKVWVMGRGEGDIVSAAMRAEQMAGSLSGRTDDAGRFTLSRIPPGSYNLIASNERNPVRMMFARDAVSVVVADADVSDVVLHLPVEATAEGYLRGTVVDGEGHPVEGVTIVASGIQQGNFNVDFNNLDKLQGQSQSGPDGRFAITNIKKGKYTLIVVQGQSQRKTLQNVDVPQDDYTITLEAKGGIAGKVVGSRGEPVASFRVAPVNNEAAPMNYNPFESREGQLYSSREGAFEVKDLEAGSYRLKLAADGYAPRTSEPIEVKSGEVTRDVTIHLSGGGTVRLHVTRAGDGGAVEGAVVNRNQGDMRELVEKFFAGADTPASGKGPQTNAQGYCTVSRLAAGEAEFRITHPKFAPASVKATVEEGRTVELSVELAQGGIIEGHVRDRAGNPIPGDSITVISNSAGFGMPAEMGMVETDASGYYTRGHLPPGNYVVMRNLFSMMGGGSGVGSKTAVVQEGMITEVSFGERGARLWGIVSKAGQPLPRARLMLVGADNTAIMAGAESDETGRYEFHGLDPGKFLVNLQGTGMGFSSLRVVAVTLKREEEKQLDFAYPAGVIRGRVLDRASGAAISEAEVYFKLAGTPDVGLPAFPIIERSDAEGRFEKGELSGGAILVSARAEGHGQADLEVQLGEGEVKEGVELRLESGGRLEGRIAGAAGDMTFPMKIVKLFRPDGSPALPGLNMVQVGEDGRYSVDGLPAGDLLVMALGVNLAPQILPTTIKVGETATLDFAMQPGIAVELTVVDGAGAPIEDARMAVRNAADFALPLQESGLVNRTANHYTLPLGREACTITIFADGYQPATLSRDYRDAQPPVKETVTLLSAS